MATRTFDDVFGVIPLISVKIKFYKKVNTLRTLRQPFISRFFESDFVRFDCSPVPSSGRCGRFGLFGRVFCSLTGAACN